jgi:hypothetical protein
MNKKQLNRFRMYEAVNLVLDTHAALVGTEGDLFTALQLLKAGQATINQNRQVQEADSSGLTKKKRELRSELIRLILLFAAGLKANATSTKNPELKTKADYKPYELHRSTDSVLADIGRLLHETALPLHADLAKYAVTEAEFQKMEQLLAEFVLAVPKRRVSINLSKVSTDNIEGVFKAQDQLLKEQVDSLMEPFRFSQPDFFHAYRNARSVVDYSGRGKAAPVELVPNPA